MFLSNQLLWALNDHARMKHPLSCSPHLADQMLIADLAILEVNRNSPDKFDRPVPLLVRINKETGEIE